MKHIAISALLLALYGPIAAAQSAAPTDSAVSDGARYDASGKLLQPADYRRWIFLTSGLDMSYRPDLTRDGHSIFDNIFVNPESWQRFQQTGHWPDGTTLVMEVRGARSKGSINQHGAFQSGEPMGLEVHVHDRQRYDGGWAFFSFGQSPASPIPQTAECYSCHRAHGAVDTTFVQFYPTLLPIAEQQHTLSAAYLKDQAAAGKAGGD